MIFNEKQAWLKVFKTNFDAVFNFYFNFIFSLEWNLRKNKQKNKNKTKFRKIVFPKLVTSYYFQKGLNPQIVENREIHKNLCKKNMEWN